MDITKTALDGGASVWENWKVTANGDIPAFADDSNNLTGSSIVDKVEFTYKNYELTINTTTVDFLSIPMTVEATFDVAATWGSERGPMGITNSLKTAAAAFTAEGTSNGVDWSNLNVSNSGTACRILSPFRHLATSPSDASAWNSYFDDYIDGLSTLYASGFQYPCIAGNHTANIYFGKITASGSTWKVDGLDKSGAVSKSGWYSIDIASFKGNSKDVFSVTTDGSLAWEPFAAINRGIAHITSTVKGWGSIYGTLLPSSTEVSDPIGGDWTPSEWTNVNAYYPSGTFGNGTTIAPNLYSKLMHGQSILGTASNQSGAKEPTEVNSQHFCYGFSVDDIWTHGSAIYGQGANAGVGTTKTATVSIFTQE